GRFLLYDALNDLSISQGNPVLAWSIYAIDTVTQNILSVVPPVVGLQIGSPALGHTSDDLLAFEAYNPTKQVSTQWAVNLFSGESKPVGTTLGGFGTPVFNGDDSAIIYTQSDQQTGLSTSTGASLVRQALSADHISPNGKATVWMADSMLGYIYRRAVKGSQPTPGNGRTAMGTTRITHNWTLVTLPQAFARPVIIAAPPSFNGSHPGVVRIRNIAPTGYQVRFQEWDYMDGQHTTETLPYLVLEAGHHRMPDGSLWEVGTYSQNGTGIWKTKSLTESFPGQPELFLTIQSTHGAQAVTVRARQITTKGFSSALYEQESLMNGHATETIGYLAIYSPTGSGSITIGGQKHPYTVRKAQVDHRWSSVLNSTIRVHEEQSKDTEVQHLQETLSLLGLGQYLFAQDVSSKGSDPIALRQKSAH
ncbi:MAG: hypothetical protein KAG26_08190, partial [Methylococcales bacterium]|nr:hypothetical protein [Methylococcales bacterium]